MTQFPFEPTRPPLDFPQVQPPRPPSRPLQPHERHATKGDIDDVVKELQAVRGVLEQIYTLMQNQAHVR